MPRFFFIAEDQLDELERQIDKLPGGETKVTYKLLEQLKNGQQLPPKLMDQLLKGPPTSEEGQPPPPTKPPAPVGRPEGKPQSETPATPPTTAQVAKGANAVAVTPPSKD